MKARVIAFACLLVGMSDSLLSAPPLEDMLKALNQSNAKLSVLSLEGYTKEYEWDNAATSWKLTPVSCTFSLIIENKKRGRYVFTAKPSITRWENGITPYFATWSTEFRDSEGYITVWEQGDQKHDGQHFLSVRCELCKAIRRKDPEHSFTWAETFLCASDFTGLEALRPFTGLPIDLFAKFRDKIVKDTGLTISANEGGLVQVKYSFSGPGQSDTHDVLLDPAKGFGLVRHTHYEKRHEKPWDYTTTYEVLEHREIADGVWYPVHCVVTRDTTLKQELVLTKATILEGSFAERGLTAKLPEDLVVRDQDGKRVTELPP